MYTPKSLLRYVHSIILKFTNKYRPKHDFVDTLHIDNKNSTQSIYEWFTVDEDSAQSILENSFISAYGQMKTTDVIKGSSVRLFQKQCNSVEKQVDELSTSNRRFSFLASSFCVYINYEV